MKRIDLLSLVSRMVGGKFIGRQRVNGGRKIKAARQAVLITSLIFMETEHSRMAQAGLGDWKPVIADYNSSLTLQSSYTKDDTHTNRGLSQTSTIQALRQSVKMNALGYVYHPDLMLFRLSGTYGEDQRFIDENDQNSNERGGFDGYDLESVFFRAKPYTLELFTRKEKPFTSSLSAVQTDEIRQESGADFKYLKQRYRAGLKYHNDTTTEKGRSNSIDDYDSYYSFIKPKLGKLDNFALNATARYQDQGTTSSLGTGGNTVSQQGSISNSFGYTIFNFNTSLSGSTAQTDGFGGEYYSDAFGFNEAVGIRLPWDFSSNIRYGTNRGTSSNNWKGQSSTLQDSLNMLGESTTNDDHYSFSLNQSLYDSLETRFSAEHDSSSTSRVESAQESSGKTFTEEPVNGIDKETEYDLESRYSKMLPRNSTMTASLLSRNTQIERLGLSSDRKLYIAGENTGIITLGDDTDTNALIAVEVLKNKTGECSTAVNNIRAINPNGCWIRLTDPTHYELILNKERPEIEFKTFSNDAYLLGQGFDPASYGKTDSIYNPFTFRVTSYRKAADATIKTTQFNTGLTLFQFISSNYQHSVTTQDGTYGSAVLEPKIISDTVNFGLSLYEWSFNATRQWIRATDMQTITDFIISYTKSRKFWERLTVKLDAKATKGWADSENSARSDEEETTKGYSYFLSGEMPLPYIKVNLRADHSYDYTKGTITRLAPNSEDVLISSRDFGIDKQTSIRYSISLNKPFLIPWINFAGSGYVRYRWQTQTTTNREGYDDGGKDRSYFHYGLNAARVWQFGATSINLNANYSIKEEVFDESGAIFRGGSTDLQREEKSNETSVKLTVVRQLF